MSKVDIFDTQNKYQIIYADPAWPYNESGSKAKVKNLHYPMMQLDEICALPVKSLQADKCILFLWVTFPRLPMAFPVMEAWGLQYHSLAFDWTKLSANGKPKWGPGYYCRQNNEICLIGVPKEKDRRIKPLVHNVLCAIHELPREHSRKPDIVRNQIVNICGDLPRIELFARHEFSGWDCWGNEVSTAEDDEREMQKQWRGWAQNG